MDKEYTTERVRRLCLGLPETSERLSHGAPSFFDREVDWDEVAGIVEDAWGTVAAQKTVEALLRPE